MNKAQIILISVLAIVAIWRCYGKSIHTYASNFGKPKPQDATIRRSQKFNDLLIIGPDPHPKDNVYYCPQCYLVATDPFECPYHLGKQMRETEYGMLFRHAHMQRILHTPNPQDTLPPPFC